MPGVFDVDTLLPSTGGVFANASISDDQGNLLMFCFGKTIANKTGDFMDNGDGLCDGNECPNACNLQANTHLQGVLILPKPGHLSQYYVFIKDYELAGGCQPGRVTASLVDLSYNNGLGKVLTRAIPILSDTLSDSRMTACKHANGRDWWLINHEYNTGGIFCQLIAPDSIYPPIVQNLINQPDENDDSGWSIFSPDGETFATTTAGLKKIILLSFNRCTGEFSNYREVQADTTVEYYVYMAFSGNGQYLYAGNNSYLDQFDLYSSNIASSKVQLVHDTAGFPGLGGIGLACDSKVYVSGWSGPSPCFSVINSPNSKAPMCDFHLRSECIPGSQIRTVPNFPNYNLGRLAGSPCDTLGLSLTEQQKEKRLSVYPNPSSEWINLEYGFMDWSKGEVTLQTVNSLGQIVIQQRLPNYSSYRKLDVSHLANGPYRITLNRQGQVISSTTFMKK